MSLGLKTQGGRICSGRQCCWCFVVAGGLGGVVVVGGGVVDVVFVIGVGGGGAVAAADGGVGAVFVVGVFSIADAVALLVVP